MTEEDDTNLVRKMFYIVQIIKDGDSIIFDCKYGDFKITKLKNKNKPQPSPQLKSIQKNLNKLRKLC